MTIRTKIHSYNFDVTKPQEKAGWLELKERLKATNGKVFETWSPGGKGHRFRWAEPDGAMIELETTHLFNNQWNTAPIPGVSDSGLRVFDWALDAQGMHNGMSPPHLRRGHWIEITDEMREIRRNTSGCGYCGKQEPSAKGNVFCPHCLGSEYLKASELYLTRMRAIDETDDRAPLTEAEKAHLLPLYREAQLHGNTERDKVRIAKKRADIAATYEKAIRDANTERDGLLWLMDHGINTNNVIFYHHTGKFSFGWRQPVDSELLSALLDVISEFRWPYEIKTADGRTLEGN